MKKPLVYIVCTGLGGIQRGFETYIDKLATDLWQEEALGFRFKVLSAYQPANHAYPHKRLPAIKRHNRWLQKLTQNIHTHFHIEQQTLFPFLLWQLIKHQPKVVYLGEYQLYCYLYKARKLLGQKWNLCLYTGGQAIPGLYNPKYDWVHHITDCYLDECNEKGINKSRQFLIPHPIAIAPFCRPLALPEQVKIKTTKAIVLSVGSIDEQVKRMHTLVKALAPYAHALYPVLVGPKTPETATIKMELEKHFGKEYLLGEYAQAELSWVYAQARVMVSCSLKESFGLVMLEAMLQQAPVLCYPWCGAQYVFQEQAHFFRSQHATEMGKEIWEMVSTAAVSKDSRKYVSDRFSWPALRADYIKMFTEISTASVHKNN